MGFGTPAPLGWAPGMICPWIFTPTRGKLSYCSGQGTHGADSNPAAAAPAGPLLPFPWIQGIPPPAGAVHWGFIHMAPPQLWMEPVSGALPGFLKG